MTNWKDILTIALGIYGALLTTYTIYRQRKDKKPDIKVSMSMGFLTGVPGDVDACLFIKASNHGESPITLSSWQFVLPNKKQLIYPSARGTSQLPFVLVPRRNYQAWVPVRVLAEALKEYGYKGKIRIKAVYFDEIDKKYFSPKFEVDIDDWSKN